MPGVLHVEKSPAQIDAEKALHSFKVNTLGPLLLLKHLTPFLPTRSSPSPSPKRIEDCIPGHAVYAMMAARVGSISDNRLGGWYSYRASKAAVFQLAKTLDAYLQASSGERAMAVALHPGTVRTDFTREFWDGGAREMLEPDEAAAKLLRVLCELDMAYGRGRCWDWRGEEVVP
jgi:NAD(P)-dependent dehydrogenase (short-subunit alcohol dehydrogenase family)